MKTICEYGKTIYLISLTKYLKIKLREKNLEIIHQINK